MSKKFLEKAEEVKTEAMVDDKIHDLAAKAETAEELKGVLEAMKAQQELEDKKHPKISKEAWASIIANGMIAGLVLLFERNGIITTKVFSFIRRGRV